jgi:hypothetical protein
MVKRSRIKRFVVFTALVAIVVLGLWCARVPLVRGLIKLEIAHTGAWLQEVDRAEVFRLGNLMESSSPKGIASADFMGYPVEAQATLNEADARAIAEQWRAIPRGYQYLHLCHEPLYGLRFERDNRIVLETTVCWNCETYDFKGLGSGEWEMWEWGFDAHSTAAQVLLGLLMKKVPPPTQEQEQIFKEYPESGGANATSPAP